MKRKRRQKPITVGFISFGCPKNTVDSERMLALIAQAELVITAEVENADVVVINTCGFIAPAKAEALEAIKQVLRRKRAGRVKKVIVAGCLSERMGTGLLAEAPGIDAVVGLGQRDAIAQIIAKAVGSSEPAVYLEHSCEKITDDRVRFPITGPGLAYLRISEGCDHNCSFCTIPSIRGRFRSKPSKLVIAEAVELAIAGVVELNIIGQDTSSYGRDLKINDGLAGLLKELEKVERIRWIRLMYLYPVGITERLIDTIAESSKVVNYLDIPIQHINDQILRAMRRPDTKKHIRAMIEKLRAAIPDIVLRTTVIVGFPGETDEQFAELLDFVKWARFEALGCFPYYAEAGTAAAQMPGQIPDAVKQQRVEELMLSQQQIAFAKNRQRIGSKLTCLVESADSGLTGWGRYYGQAPDIDSICIISNCAAKPGDFVSVKVTDIRDYDLVVEQI